MAMTHSLDTAALATAAACIVLWSVFSARLERLYISAPIALLVMGLVATHGPLAIIHFNPHSSTVRSLAEVTLALVLFTDASRVNINELRRDIGLPVRLLAFGLPLTIGVGTATAFAIIPGVSWWVAATIGAIVAPTDAALGASIIGDTRVPNRIRRLLNVESGLNDGIATPFVNLFLAGAVASEVTHSMSVLTAAADLLIGAGIGGGVGLVGGWVLTRAAAVRWTEPGFRPLAALGLAFFAYSSAIEAHGNGFIAAFIGGMVFGSVVRPDLESTVAFTEEAGGLLSSRGLAHLRCGDGGPRLHACDLAGLSVRAPRLDRRPDGASGPVAAGLWARPIHRGIRRMVWATGAGVGGVRTDRIRQPRTDRGSH